MFQGGANAPPPPPPKKNPDRIGVTDTIFYPEFQFTRHQGKLHDGISPIRNAGYYLQRFNLTGIHA